VNKQVFIRSAEFQFRDDGRTLDGCIVPYGEVIDVAEIDDAGELVRYREQFLPHSLYNMAQGFKSRSGKGMNVPLLIDHEESSMERLVGFATMIESRDDGAYGTFRLYDDANIVKIRSVLSESHTGLSVKFRDIREPKLIDDVVSRVQVYVAHVAATPIPAYAGAAIGSIRSNGEVVTEATPTLNEIREWLAAERQTTS
jgi:HK97 family phage prohead protease